MRRTVGIVAVMALAFGLAGVVPASATHCEPGDIAACPNPINVSILEGVGFVCDEAKGFGANPRCTYHADDLTPVVPANPRQGLYWPGVGPSARGPFSFKAGPDLSVPASLCVSSDGGLGCTFDSKGQLTPGILNGQQTYGAYCGSSHGAGTSDYKAAGSSITVRATFGWEQSAATILPLQGTVSSPASMAGATVVGFTSSRGTNGGGNCGATQATTQFQVEGMIVTY